MSEPKIVTEPGRKVSDEDRERCEAGVEELRSMGIRPHLVRVHPNGDPEQYYFNFPTGEPSYLFRKKMVDGGYEVRQEMGDKMLVFYAVKPERKKASWD